MLSDAVLTRIRAEFHEMPGLKLTMAQATRLWCLSEHDCLEAIDRLVAERFLYRTPSGAVIALPSATRMARAEIATVSARCPSCRHLNEIARAGTRTGKPDLVRCSACSQSFTVITPGQVRAS